MNFCRAAKVRWHGRDLWRQTLEAPRRTAGTPRTKPFHTWLGRTIGKFSYRIRLNRLSTSAKDINAPQSIFDNTLLRAEMVQQFCEERSQRSSKMLRRSSAAFLTRIHEVFLVWYKILRLFFFLFFKKLCVVIIQMYISSDLEVPLTRKKAMKICPRYDLIDFYRRK